VKRDAGPLEGGCRVQLDTSSRSTQFRIDSLRVVGTIQPGALEEMRRWEEEERRCAEAEFLEPEEELDLARARVVPERKGEAEVHPEQGCVRLEPALHTGWGMKSQREHPQVDLVEDLSGDFQLTARVQIADSRRRGCGGIAFSRGRGAYAICWEQFSRKAEESLGQGEVVSAWSVSKRGHPRRMGVVPCAPQGGAVYLRLTRCGEAVSFATSADGGEWQPVLQGHWIGDGRTADLFAFARTQGPRGEPAEVTVDQLWIARRRR
jgi:hypothetical protein